MRKQRIHEGLINKIGNREHLTQEGDCGKIKLNGKKKPNFCGGENIFIVKDSTLIKFNDLKYVDQIALLLEIGRDIVVGIASQKINLSQWAYFLHNDQTNVLFLSGDAKSKKNSNVWVWLRDP